MTMSLFSPRRVLGRTDFVATILGIGDLADHQLSLQQLVATVRRALDTGLNLIDTAPGYEDGYSEQIVGQALKGYRDGVFVIDKIDHLDQPVAPQIEASLTRLQMDYTDLICLPQSLDVRSLVTHHRSWWRHGAARPGHPRWQDAVQGDFQP